MALPIVNPYLSNGTCYFAVGKQSHSSFIPCGNAAIGFQTCCGAADFCLSSNACFNAAFRQTYLAGCTDPTYRDGKCPDKPNLSNEPWTGLAYCNGTSEEWFACRKGGSSTLRSGDPCNCPDEPRTIAFKDKSVLERIASLPRVTGSRIQFEANHYPSPQVVIISTTINGQSTALSSSVPLSVPSRTGTGNPDGPTETSSSADAAALSTSGLSTGAKAGIGAGIALTGLLLLGALIFFFLRRRRQTKTRNGGSESGGANHHSVFDPIAPHHGLDDGSLVPGFDAKQAPGFERYSDSTTSASHTATGIMPSPVTPAVSELSGHAARPWSMRSELQGSEHQDSPGSPSPQPSLEQQQQPMYRPYRPPGESSLVPPALVPGGGHAQHQNPNRQGALSPVAELP